jgi:hypothetical protein
MINNKGEIMGIPKMLEGIITEEEEQFFMQYGNQILSKAIHQKDISHSFHRIGNMRKMVEKMIASNEVLSKSNDKHSSWMKWLTFALVGAAIAQVVVAVLGL